ncbi:MULTISPECIES: M56 family metallopeptidase [unclassified Polaribacter]|uniref:M56 family metallopeptidase n=1 Tax=unclassified Polaribacter TaxID=196858 RepID=UPI0011BD5EF3|nr:MULTISPECIES: M56 family metallopeptidase [unclassified Polaribacter]TXD53292.1 BlaR1 peptidase M56 [Polaribacter sp. IC063]TXD60255.1 BlaR1 peptidase M56 [Polaribacter sp. IC066]
MINYILQVVLFQVLFLAIYDFFLSKETFFTKNRWYLISTPILSFLIPLIKIPSFQKAVPQEYIVYLPEIFLSPEKAIQKVMQGSNLNDSINYISILFWLGVCFFSILFLMKLGKIINLIKKYKAEQQDDFTLVFIPNQTKAFSFFNYIFLGKEIPFSQQEKIIQHEMVHSKQKHSIDLLFFEFLKIVMWFNPMIYLYQKRITLLHEYISDGIVSKKEAKEIYINNLLSNYFQVENIAFVNQFYKQSLIKKRIIMMTKKQSKKMNQLKYLLLVPVLASMLIYSSCSENSAGDIVESKKELQTRYFEMKEGIETSKGEKETYLDSYFGIGKPEGVEVAYSGLTLNEKSEYDEVMDKIQKSVKSKFSDMYTHKIFKGKNNRKVLATIIDFSKMKRDDDTEIVTETKEASFMTIDKAPTFPGCESGDKDCFSKSVQKHFSRNFDADLPKSLGLTTGRKRVFIGFKIDTEGAIVDVQVRAPHEDIKAEVLSAMSSLPKMIPGEQDGNTVAVKYSIPFTIVVE